MASEWFVGVDIGGTFTDVVLAEEGGTVVVRKVRTTGDDPVQGVVAGVTSVLAEAGLTGGRIGRVVHGTTLATNLVLERKGARVAFATTAGFGDLIRVPRGGGAVAEGAETLVGYVPSPPFVPPWLTVEVPERLDARGEPVRDFAPPAARRSARALARLEPEAVAVCFLHAYTDAVHEQRLAEAWRALRPDVPIYLSSEISPGMREYGRAMTTVIAAYVGPAMESYLRHLGRALTALGIDCPVHVMESSGGVMSLAQVARRAVQTIESGPAAGVVATQLLSGLTGDDNLISFDMGGTTAKCGLVRDRNANRRYEFFVGGRISWSGRQAGGYPVRVPVIDLAEVGAGGGSIAWVDDAGGLRVGPQSAGAQPGPACYALGGARPTATDANLVLGYFDPRRFAGGSIGLSADLAEQAIAESIAGALGMTTLQAASAVHTIVTSSMANAVRMTTIERGLDPRDFTLVSFGGSGPVHAARIAELFGIARVIVPAYAGVRSAVGLLGTDMTTDQVQSCLTASGRADADTLAGIFAELAQRAAAELGVDYRPSMANGRPGRSLRCSRMVDVRYQGQAHEVVVPVPPGPFDAAMVERISGAFFEQYKELFGSGHRSQVEIVNCRLRLEKVVPKWTPARRPARVGRRRAPTPREAWFEEEGGMVDVPAFDWTTLTAGDTFAGPAVVDGPDATLVVPRAFAAVMDDWGNLLLEQR